jgi:hypothetical protein
MSPAEARVRPAESSPKPVQTMGCHRLSYLQPQELPIASHSNL